MSEALLFGPYGEIRDFVHEGKRRGEHRTAATYSAPEFMTYTADLQVSGVLPIGRVIRKLSTLTEASDVRVFGPRVDVERLEGTALTIRTTGWRFFDTLIDTPVASLIKQLESHWVALTIRPLPENITRITLELKNGNALEVREDAIALAHALLASADTVIEKQMEFEDCAEMLAALREREGAVDDADAIESLMGQVNRGTGWMSGICERVGDEVIASLRLPSDVAALDGNVRATLIADKTGVTTRLVADLALPEVDAQEARLTPEEPGIIGWVKRLGELEIGDKAVDDMFRIFAGPGAIPFLIHAKEPLLALGHGGATVRVTAHRLVVSVDELAFEEAVLTRMLEAVGILWREVAEHRSGLIAAKETTGTSR